MNELNAKEGSFVTRKVKAASGSASRSLNDTNTRLALADQGRGDRVYEAMQNLS